MPTGRPDYRQGIDIEAQDLSEIAINLIAQSLDRISTITKNPSGTTVVFKSEIIAGATLVMHTVTAGKTLFLTSASLALGSLLTSDVCYLAVRNAIDVLQFDILRHRVKATADNSANVANSMALIPPLEIAAGWDVVVYSPDVDIAAAATFSGWEE